jgi:2-oxoglutarate ferredoxin oxidoreductase subunit delta
MTAAKKKKSRLHIHEDYCKSCRLCVDFCPRRVLEMTTDRLNVKGLPFVLCVHPDACNGCQTCVTVCPDAVIDLFEEVD